MNLQLKRLRKEAGYSNRDDFARVCGVQPATYKSWETESRKIRLEDACMIADVLGCSLDELAGRDEYVGRFADRRQNAMNDDYSVLSEPGKDSAAASGHGIRLGEDSQKETDPATLPRTKEKIA